MRPGVVPETTSCVREKDLHRDINPKNINPIDNASGRPFEAMENRHEGQGHTKKRFIPLATKEISLTDSCVRPSVLFAFQLGHIQMGDSDVLKVFREQLKEYRILCLTLQFRYSPS